uniref:Uncharacterized protein n=1 Tax=Rhizophora mucronata TaxID=61149 RepID=A0A2P2QBP2_RHIMU
MENFISLSTCLEDQGASTAGLFGHGSPIWRLI